MKSRQKRSLYLTIISFLFVSIFASAANAGITTVVRGGDQPDPANCAPVVAPAALGTGSTAYCDRDYTWTDVAGKAVEGAEYLIVANDDKDIVNYTLTVTVDVSGTMYLLWNDLITADTGFPTWASDLGFADTGEDVTLTTGANDPTFSIYSLAIENGVNHVTLYGANDSDRAIYSVAFVEAPLVDIEVEGPDPFEYATVVAGSGPDNIVHTYTVTNLGPDTAGDALTQFVFGITAPNSGFSCSLDTAGTGDLTLISQDTQNALFEWELTLAPQAVGTMEMTCTAGASVIHNEVVSTSLELISIANGTDTDPNNNLASLQTTVIRESTFNVTKTWADGSGEVNVMLTCNDVVVDSATTSGLAASFTLTGFADATNCVVTEEIPAGFAPTYTGCSAEPVVSGTTYDCGIANAVTNATFMVTKEFSDLSDDPVTVTLSCSGGLPLSQSFDISDGNPVNFVLTNFIEGEVDCEITEESVADSYTPSFDNGTVVSETSCAYNGVTSGPYTCDIFNAADAANYTVYMDWVVDDGFEDIISPLDVTVTCDSDILSVDDVPPAQPTQSVVVTLGDGESAVLEVEPADGGATCSAVQETIPLSGVESEASEGCTDANLGAAGEADCTFTNTVFFEGIPTLSQYGLAIMALLMLGVGFIGFRRFA